MWLKNEERIFSSIIIKVFSLKNTEDTYLFLRERKRRPNEKAGIRRTYSEEIFHMIDFT